MMKIGYTVCLCFGREKCELETSEIAARNNAISWEVIPVSAPYSRQPAYKGTVYLSLYSLTPTQVWAAWKAQQITAGELADWQQRNKVYFDQEGNIK